MAPLDARQRAWHGPDQSWGRSSGRIGPEGTEKERANIDPIDSGPAAGQRRSQIPAESGSVGYEEAGGQRASGGLQQRPGQLVLHQGGGMEGRMARLVVVLWSGQG